MPLRFLQRIRESINIRIYGSKNRVIQVMRLLRLVVAIGMSGFLIYFHGYPQTAAGIAFNIFLIKAGFSFFIFSFLLRIFFEFEPAKFIRQNWLEGTILLVLLADGLVGLFSRQDIFSRLFSQSLDFFLFLQLVLISVVFIELGKASQRLGMLKIKPAIMFFFSFLILIAVGTGLLLMPEMVNVPGSIRFEDALFTSVSASCVTGLTVLDTATTFTMKGKAVIMILFQLGGLNIISFAAFFGAFMRKGVGIRANSMIKDFMSYDSLSSTQSMLKKVIGFTLLIELTGMLMVYLSWSPEVVFASEADRIFTSAFHAISAFNNAGFSTFSAGMAEQGVQQSLVTHVVLGILIFLGGIGVPVLNDWLDPGMMRKRMFQPWRRLQVSSRLARYTSLILILVGAGLFYLMEMRNPAQYAEGGLRNMNGFSQLIHAMFQSISSRTAGFNTLNFGLMANSTLLLFIFLMFVGASPGGTGGGIKTTTIALIFLSALATIRGKKYVEIFRNTISNELLYKAFSIFLFTLSGVFIGTVALSITDPHINFLYLAFEEVSAFSTTGLSTGITAQLSLGGKIILMISMLVGRVGVLTVAFAVSRKAMTNNYKYPDAYVMLG
jgi:trk system potassium uptake protein TrkH